MSIIRVGIGGWTFEPWRGVFYPKGLPHARELEFASREVTAIEVNATFYRTQRPEDREELTLTVPDRGQRSTIPGEILVPGRRPPVSPDRRRER